MKMNKKTLIIAAVAVAAALAVLIFLFPQQYNDGLEQEGIVYTDPLPSLTLFRKYLNAKAPMENYILLADKIVVGTAKGRCEDNENYINFEVEEFLKGDLTDKTIFLANIPEMGFQFRENDKYLVFLTGTTPNELACFNITDKNATVCLKEAVSLFKHLPRDSEKLVKFVKNHDNIGVNYVNTRAGLNSSYPPDVIWERTDFSYECKVTDVKFAFTDSLQEKIYTVYAKPISKNDNFDMIALEQVLDDKQAKSIKGKQYMGYFAYVCDFIHIYGFLDVEGHMQ